MDEIAAQMRTDPVSLRLNHLRDERLIAVLKEAAKAAAWEYRHSPVSTIRRTGIVRGRGIAGVAYEGDNGYAALVSEVDVDLDSGKVHPRRFVIAIDSGPISNPDGLRNQTEGGILQGASRALGERVTWDSKKITSIDWETYNSLYLDLATPQIEVVLVNRKDVPALGAGETAITLSAASLGNAIFDASGLRLREIPFSPEHVRAALRKSSTQEKVS
jgi:CO/xanthine dehydrogenase Mo-binding subunit